MKLLNLIGCLGGFALAAWLVYAWATLGITGRLP